MRFLLAFAFASFLTWPAFICEATADDVTGESATVLGIVTDLNGVPLSGAQVRIVLPATEWLLVHPNSGHRVAASTTDDRAHFRLNVTLQGERTFAIDARKPGYLPAFTSLIDQPTHRAITAGDIVELSFRLEPGIYLAGTVVDQDGTAVRDVSIEAIREDASSTNMTDHTTTDDQGRFEVFGCWPVANGYRTRLNFKHPAFVITTVRNVYELSPRQREHLHVRLEDGHSISGRTLDVEGKPVSGAFVWAERNGDLLSRKTTITLQDGTFSLFGLPARQVIRVCAISGRQRFTTRMTLDRDANDLDLRLQSPTWKEPVESIELFGMTLATINPELRETYFLDSIAYGVIVLDPGQNSRRLGIGELREGDYFRAAGWRPNLIGSVSGFVYSLLKAIENPPPYGLQVSFVCRRPDMKESGGGELLLTADDIAELRKVAAALASGADGSDQPQPAILGVVIASESLGEIRVGTVTNILPNSAADKAGIQVDRDVILAVEGTAIRNPRHLQEIIRSHSRGDRVLVKVRRGVPPNHSDLDIPIILGP